ncbi:hypothetical protein OOT46_21420 [Aquabacterium sp. A7-Y]|uniref:hypothetical protein n=1 Tax=Aquabacterium sp. A7-Y TaxID=1349605 RepID=UPI00223D0846|nr:hypothetical protein [Aquabacterium sp. A7-Y]MCW7540397.1 hypothetical protein [Aquabacterium sp. A7-Y]
MSPHPLLIATHAWLEAERLGWHLGFDFPIRFAAQRFWVAGHQRVGVRGTDTLSLHAETQPDGFPKLRVYVTAEAAENASATAANSFVSCAGAVLLGLTRCRKFDLSVTDGRHGTALSYETLHLIRSSLLLASQNARANTADQRIGLPDIRAFCTEVHRYCSMQPDIRQCWICHVVSLGSIHNVGLVVEGAMTIGHRDHFAHLGRHLLPPGSSLLDLSPSGSFDEHLGLRLREHRPLYTSDESQGRRGALEQRPPQPRVPIVVLNLLGDKG